MAIDDNNSHAMDRLLFDVKGLATRYYALTGKPLGVTGEVAELEAARLLSLKLAAARTAGYDAIDTRRNKRVQIKGRAVDHKKRYVGRCPSIKCGDQFDLVLLVLLDKASLEPLEIWESDEAAVMARLEAPGSAARNQRGSLGISQFKSIARLVWRAGSTGADPSVGK
jgi:hypothetical protein